MKVVSGTCDGKASATPRPSHKLALSATIGPGPNLCQHGLGLVNHGDCLDVMRRMPADFVDLIVTSPPYADARSHTYGGIRPDDYVQWFVERAAEMHRVLKPTGSFVLNIKEKAVDGERHTYVLELILALKREVGFRWVEEYIWHKTTSAPGKWKYRFRDAWERLLHFSKSADVKMNQQDVRVPVGDWTRTRLRKLSANDRERRESGTRSQVGRRISAWSGRKLVFPSNVLHRPPVCHNTGHSAAFPEWMPEFFIRLFTDQDDVVLDPFLGSGTTFRVAQALGRHAVGIDSDRDCLDRFLESMQDELLTEEPLAEEPLAKEPSTEEPLRAANIN